MDQNYADWKQWNVADFGRWSRSDDRYYAWQVGRASAQRNGLRILEIGFGNGGLLGWLRSRGHATCGVEASAVLVTRARDAGFEAVGNLEELDPGRQFDLIVAIDVLEHVPADSLLDLLRQFKRRLAPDGRLWLRFPNAESPFGLRSQHGDITHVHALGLSKLRQVAALTGLAIEHSGDRLPWTLLPPGRRVGGCLAHLSRSMFEWRMRKSYGLGRDLDFGPNQSVILRDAGAAHVRSGNADT